MIFRSIEDRVSTGGSALWGAPFELGAGEDLPFDEAILRIEAAQRFGIDPSLEPVRALLDELGHPERAYPCVQVVGTNGKTSTSRYTAALLRAAGLRCGLYTSPHLVSYTERVEVDGRVVDERAFAHGVSMALAAWRRMRDRGDEVTRGGCTEFELLTAAAFVMYAEAGVEVCVLEAGLGGRWDATSAADPVAVALTGVGLDHTRILGDTLEAIAAEKAAVIQPGRAVVLGTNAVRPKAVLDVVLDACGRAGVLPSVVAQSGKDRPQTGGAQASDREAEDPVDGEPSGAAAVKDLPDEVKEYAATGFSITSWPKGLGAPLVFDVEVEVERPDGRVRASYPGVELTAPAYQAQNISCALALATAFLGKGIDAQDARRAIAACPVPGRFEVVRRDPVVVLDACHNPQSAKAFAQAIVDAEPERAARPALLIGALADKDHAGIVADIVPLFERIYVTQSTSDRALPAGELAQEIRTLCGVEPTAVIDDVAAAVDALYGESFVGCGTITLIGDIAAIMQDYLVH